MDDLISRRAAIDEIEWGITYAKAINKETGEIRELFAESNDELRKAVDRVKALPTIDPVKHGKWIIADYMANNRIVYHEASCSNCGIVVEDEDPTWNYCPMCGAKMDGGIVNAE